ncbi:MAG TPA: Ig-like domain-containing protein, partial [Gemmatimonadaceae bacterium]|nr:Ig-like domain-containing protein [Gemmatimonadaceae bacterium]
MRLFPSVLKAAATSLILALAACKGEATLRDQVASVSVTAASTVATVGQAVQFSAEPRTAAGAPLPDRPVSWSSSAASVASVSPTGLVTAVAPGGAMISASSEGQSGSVPFTVTSTAPPPPP